MNKLVRTLAVVAALAVLLLSGACNTVKGAGQDIKSVGRSIQRAVAR